MEENKDLNEETQVSANTNAPMEAPIANEENNTVTPPIEEVVEPALEPEQRGTGDTITFDYNQLYQNGEEINPQEQPVEVQPNSDTNTSEESLPDELKPLTEEKSIYTVDTKSQKEKKESRQSLIFIAILFAVLIVAVLVVFPKMLSLN